ncbi:MAG TPA: metallopeptidase TldD-related protein [Bryobacteraceae bacterium]|nr:metallopeptidase TldD-related protein [Bryobacteraceae bacterium]
MFTKQEAKNLADKVMSYAKLPECRVSLNASENVFIRFANNGITTSGYALDQNVTINSTTEDKRSGTATVTELTDDALRHGVEQAEALAKISRPNPEDMPALGPQKYPELANFDTPTGNSRGDALIGHVKAIIDGARANKLTTAGFVQRSANWVAVANKAGLFGYHQYTDSTLTDTMRNAAGSSSGWATQISTSIKDLNGQDAARVAMEKCLKGDNKKRLEPGKYTVILEPAAVSDLIGYMGFGFGARGAEQGQSFLSKKGGKAGETLLGEKLFPEHITLRSDPFNPKFAASPWAGSLLPNEKIAWIENGVVKNLSYDRFWASKAGKKPTPFPGNLILEGQEHTLADLIKSTEKAVLVTRFWYIRLLQPQTLQVTGLTRDGVFLVENGKVSDPVMNFRWNESPVRVLQNTKMMTQPVRTQGAEAGSSFAPAVLATDFNFASISDAV